MSPAIWSRHPTPLTCTHYAMQKVVRKYFRDARCLTDLVRGVMLCESVCTSLMPLRVLPVILFFVILVTAMVCINGFQIGDVRVVTEHLVSMSAIGDADPVGSGSPADEENLLRGDDFNKQFVLCKIKDRQSALLILRCAQGYCSMRCGISVLLSLNLCDGFQVYIGKEEGLP